MITMPFIILLITEVCLGIWFYFRAKSNNKSFDAIGTETWLIGILMIVILICYTLYFWIK